jgi:cytochrome c oxidase subunit 1
MTATDVAVPARPHHAPLRGLTGWITSTDHKVIGKAYCLTGFFYFMLSGAFALAMRAELARPGLQLLTHEQYNQLFTMHGSAMMYLFATPFAFGLANFVVPLQIGAPDMSFPRLNALSFWLFFFGAFVMVSGFLTPDGAADFGWFSYAPLSTEIYAPHAGVDLWIVGLLLTGLGTTIGAINLVTTIFTLRAPGMTMFRMPVFTWNMLVVSVLTLLAFPVLTVAMLMLATDRHLGGHVFSAANNGPILWQHLFWFFGHPEVYIVALPFFGVVSDVLPVFSKKPVFGYKGLIFATFAIAAYSLTVWAHHMLTTGAVVLPYFAGLTFVIAVPTGVKFFNWIGTMWGGSLTFPTPMLWSIGFLVTFLVGGLTGVMLASPPINFHVHDSYFVVAHFHYVLFGSIVFGAFAGVYYWWPKMTGRLLGEGLGKLHFWITFIGFHTTFFVQHILGIRGMPRRIADYSFADGFASLNTVSTVGSFLLGISTVVFLVNVALAARRPADAPDDPWVFGQTLEWLTTSPPPRQNFRWLPRIRSNRPAWDHRYPDHPGLTHHRQRKASTDVAVEKTVER